MRTYIGSSASGKSDVNYRECIEALAFAKHLEFWKVPRSPLIVIDELIENDLLQAAINPCGVPGAVNSSRRVSQFVTMRPSSAESRFFEPHPRFMPKDVENLYIQPGASLASCIRETLVLVSEKPKGGSWKTIIGSDQH